MRPTDIFQTIRDTRPDLRKSEQKVADFVLAAAHEVIHMRIVDLAQEAHVSEPTVVRFCRAIGCNSFQAFKVELAQYVAQKPKFRPFSLSEHDSAQQYTAKVFDSVMETLGHVRERLDPALIEAAVTALAHAQRVELYGFGASSAAIALASAALPAAKGRPVVVDAYDEHGDFTAWLRASGFEAQRPLYRMRRPGRAPTAPAGASGLIEFAILGPEFG